MRNTRMHELCAAKVGLDSCGGLAVKASASQLGGRRFESRTDKAGWLATSYVRYANVNNVPYPYPFFFVACPPPLQVPSLLALQPFVTYFC